MAAPASTVVMNSDALDVRVVVPQPRSDESSISISLVCFIAAASPDPTSFRWAV
jgi:hypothetical protein